MMLQVTVELYSGRPNPSWVLQEKEAKDVIQAIRQYPEIVTSPTDIGSRLGFRGLLLTFESADLARVSNLPVSFVIAAGNSPNEEMAKEIAERLVRGITSLSKVEYAHTEVALTEELMQTVLNEIAKKE